MAEKHTPVKVVRINYECDGCHGADLEFTGITLDSLPQKYVHRCPKCGASANLRHTYPTVGYVGVGGDG